jgi:hypothetical protein
VEKRPHLPPLQLRQLILLISLLFPNIPLLSPLPFPQPPPLLSPRLPNLRLRQSHHFPLRLQRPALSFLRRRRILIYCRRCLRCHLLRRKILRPTIRSARPRPPILRLAESSAVHRYLEAQEPRDAACARHRQSQISLI